MPEIITHKVPLDHLWMGLYDSGEADHDISLAAERIVDISDICQEITIGVGQAVIKYGRAKRGLIAQIMNRYDFGVDAGSTMHLFPDELGIAGMVSEDYMIHRANVLGCNILVLAEVISEFAPSSDSLD